MNNKFINTILDSIKDKSCTRFRLKGDPISFTDIELENQKVSSLYISSKEISVGFDDGYIKINLDTFGTESEGSTFISDDDVSKLLSIIEMKILVANIREENK